jgi:hypothetical protein
MHERLATHLLIGFAGLLVAAGAAFMLWTMKTLREAKRTLKQIRRGPEVIRDGDGRPTKERI